MRVRLQTLFLVTTWLAVAFAVLGPRLAKWWSAEPPQVPEDSQTIVLKPRCEGVNSLTFSPDGKYLTSIHQYLEPVGSHSSRILFSPEPVFVMLWDVQNRGNLARFRTPGGQWGAAQFTPDGKRLAILSLGSFCFWNIKDQTFQFTQETDVCQISPSFRSFMTYPDSEGRRVLKSMDMKSVAALAPGEHADVWAITPDSSLVALGYRWPGEPKRIEIWNMTQGKVQATLPSSIGSRMCASFSPDGKLFACASIDGKDASVFDTETGKPRGKFGPLRGPVWCLAFSPNGKTLAVGGEVGEVHWWDVATGGSHGQNGFGSSWGVTAVAFSPDGTRLAIGDGDGKIKLIPISE